MSDRPVVSGVDGCPGGWLEVAWTGDPAEAPRVRLHGTFAALLDGPSRIIAVDMPIGLPRVARPGGRTCDIEARANLGERQSSVFPVPSRAAILCTDYWAACEASLQFSWPPRKVSKQCFHLFAKIREIDDLMSPERQERVFEVHPELAFWALNGMRPLDLAKKIRGRPNPEGLALRTALLEQAGFPVALVERPDWPASVVGPDDLLDACAGCWSALRLLRGEAVRFPVQSERDERGLRMEICA